MGRILDQHIHVNLQESKILLHYLSLGLAVFVLIGAMAFLFAVVEIMLGIVCRFNPPCAICQTSGQASSTVFVKRFTYS